MQNPFGTSPIIAMFQGRWPESDSDPPTGLIQYAAYGCTVLFVASGTSGKLLVTLNSGVDDNLVLVQTMQYGTGSPFEVDTGLGGIPTIVKDNQFTLTFFTPPHDGTGIFNFVVYGAYDGLDNTP